MEQEGVFLSPKRKKSKLCRQEVESLSRQELVDKVLQLEAYNVQLQNTLKKLLAESEGTASSEKRKRPFEFSKHGRRHILLKFLYLGWNYQGLASQENTTRTIEYHMFSALTKACLIENRQSCNYHRCGRTDKGVSSFSQTISLDVRSKLSEEEIQRGVTDGELNYQKMLNRLLPEDIKVLSWTPVSQQFSARFDCKTRTYKYFFPRGNLDIDSMDKAAQYLLGTNDFRNFCKLDVKNGVVNYTRDVQFVQIRVKCSDPFGNSAYDLCELTIKGKAFLWHQIRCIMGVLILVGQHQEHPDVVKDLLAIDKNPCKPQYNIAADLPLNLFKCEYEDIVREVKESEGIDIVERSLQCAWGRHAVRAGMIRCMLQELENEGSTCGLTVQADWLLQGVSPRVYQPLLSRPTCESLGGRIQHYKEKHKLDTMEQKSLNDSVDFESL